jgi:hypothetical protein
MPMDYSHDLAGRLAKIKSLPHFAMIGSRQKFTTGNGEKQ